jgi:hypothetical protein
MLYVKSKAKYKGFTPGPAGWRVKKEKLEEMTAPVICIGPLLTDPDGNFDQMITLLIQLVTAGPIFVR